MDLPDKQAYIEEHTAPFRNSLRRGRTSLLCATVFLVAVFAAAAATGEITGGLVALAAGAGLMVGTCVQERMANNYCVAASEHAYSVIFNAYYREQAASSEHANASVTPAEYQERKAQSDASLDH